MDNKRKALLIVIASLLVLTISITFAYYSAVVQGTGNVNAEASANTAVIGEVEFNGENTFDTTNIGRDIYPGFIGVQIFTIEPYKDGTGIYEIDLQATVPSQFGSDIRLTIYKTSDTTNNNIESEDGTLTIVNNNYTKQDVLTMNGVLEKAYEGILTTTSEEVLEQVKFVIENDSFTTPTVTPDGYYTYYAVYEYLDNGDQNNQQGLNFSSKITVKYVTESEYNGASYITSLVANATKGSLAVIDNGVEYDTDGETELCTKTMAYDDYGNLRYVGENPCNYVSFNGEQTILADEYQFYADNYVSQSYDSLDDCENQVNQNGGKIGDSLQCKYNEDTTKYDLVLNGFLSQLGNFHSLSDCQSNSIVKVFSQSIPGGCRVNGNKTGVGGWRIIGIVDGKLKLIRNNKIGDYSWDSSSIDINKGAGISQWGESGEYKGADLMKLLNPGYENNMDSLYTNCVWNSSISGYQCTLVSESSLVSNSLYWNRGLGNCYNSWYNSYVSCDFRETGLTSDSKSMIDNHVWFLGTNDGIVYDYKNISAKAFYELERSNNTSKICASGNYCADSVERTTVWQGYIGLVSPSDIGFAVGGDVRTNCLENTYLYRYSYSDCHFNDWLINFDEIWSILPTASSTANSVGFYVTDYGDVIDTHLSGGKGIYPSLFLKSEVKISGGDGTPTNPYTLSLN